MTNELINILRQNDLNALILKKLNQHSGSMGQLTEDEVDIQLPQYIVDNMNVTSKQLADLIVELNTVFVEKNITANSAEDYVKFLCDLLPEYLMSPTYENLLSLSKQEIEALVITQTQSLTVEQMRAGLIENAWLKRAEDETLLSIKEQYKVLDDGIITDAYKTLLHKQFNIAIQPQ